MLRVSENGQAIALEIWSITLDALGEILLSEPAGLSIGKVILSNGQEVLGVLGEPFLCEGQKEITEFFVKAPHLGTSVRIKYQLFMRLASTPLSH
jgi:hypothetical protein